MVNIEITLTSRVSLLLSSRRIPPSIWLYPRSYIACIMQWTSVSKRYTWTSDKNKSLSCFLHPGTNICEHDIFSIPWTESWMQIIISRYEISVGNVVVYVLWECPGFMEIWLTSVCEDVEWTAGKVLPSRRTRYCTNRKRVLSWLGTCTLIWRNLWVYSPRYQV